MTKSTLVAIAFAFSVTGCLIAQDKKSDESKLKKELESATAICLAEITKVDEKDARPADGNWTATLTFKFHKSKGKPPETIRVIKGYGGMYPRGQRPKLKIVIPHKLMAKGEKMWLVFNKDKVVRCWTADAKDIPKAVTESVAKKGSDEKSLEPMLKEAKGVALVEIESVSEKDGRPYDGNYTVTFKFKIVKSKGDVPGTLTMVKAFGGRRAGPPPALPSVLKPDSMSQGEKYWLVFSDKFDAKKFPRGIAAWWPADSKDLPKALGKFVDKK